MPLSFGATHVAVGLIEMAVLPMVLLVFVVTEVVNDIVYFKTESRPIQCRQSYFIVFCVFKNCQL